MYKIAIIPKIHNKYEYSTAYGSQHHNLHIKSCLEKIIDKKKIYFEIIYSKNYFFKYFYLRYLLKFDGILFIGIDKYSKQIINNNSKLDIFIWSFNQIEWANRESFLEKTDIIFEQSTRNIEKFNNKQKKIIYTPLAFQHEYNINYSTNYNNNIEKHDLVFIGTLDRSRRETAKNHRFDILEGLLKKKLTILLFNGRGESKIEKVLISKLKKYQNFTYIHSFGGPSDYRLGKYALNLPFHELGSLENININWGMTKQELENQIWLVHWDTFRCIGSKSNMITFDCKELRDLGLNENNCNFYRSDIENFNQIIEEIYFIVKSGKIKEMDNKTWEKNSYLSRWEMIIKNINSLIKK
tara:strand:+ start:2077 stop:3138 length:1062 start_codon:yes stop_codon:yes gene_type:complete